VALAATFLAAFGWFALIQNWKMALWCMGAFIVAVTIALILSADDP
jgi:hypothetical protein